LTKQALLIQAGDDKRIFFVIPWQGQSLIGTTDTDYNGNPDDVAVEEEDVDYLMEAAGRVLPKAGMSRQKIVTTFAGLRPLVPRPGAPSKISRNHEVDVSYTGVVYVKGGKYTTYRKIAEDTLIKVWGSCSPRIRAFRVFGGGPQDTATGDYTGELTAEQQAYLKQQYGSRYGDVLRLVRGRPELSERIVPELPMIKAQIVYARDVEMAQTADDVIERRLGLQYRLADTAVARAVVEELP
jgi:glycerol-3-phosphate dehydrogenase